jgi:hypothetical protein
VREDGSVVPTGTRRTSPKVLAFLVALATWMVIVVVAAIVYSAGFRANYELKAEGRMVAGVVTSTNPGDHEYCTYQYRVDGRLYENNSDGCPNGVTVGSPIRVKYLPRDPDVAAVGDYIRGTPDSLVGGSTFVLLICTLFAIVVGRITYWGLQRTRVRTSTGGINDRGRRNFRRACSSSVDLP